MTYKDIYIQKKLPFGLWFFKYWPAEFMIQKGGDPINLSFGEDKKQRKWIKYIKFPWAKAQQQKYGLNKSGAWEKEPDMIGNWDAYRNFGMRFNLPVKCQMKYRDEVQEAWAEIKYYRYKRPHHWLRFAPWLYPWVYEIYISFDREMGSQRGSWKGGVLGIGATVRKGETIADTLEREMRTRNFCRR